MSTGLIRGTATNREIDIAVSPRTQWTDYALVLVAGAVLAGHLALILWLILNYSTNLPVRDTWQMVEISDKFHQGRLTFEDFWWPHAGVHRLVILRLQTLFLIELTGWNNQIMLVVHVFLVLLTGFLLIAAARITLSSWQAALIVSSPMFLVLLTMGRYHNWLKPFTDKIPTALGAAVCVWALAARPPGRWRFLLAIGGALYASLSSFGGLAIWLAFFPVLLLLNPRWGGIWAIVAVGFIGLYVLNLGTGDETSTVSFALPDTPAYVLAFLGAPLAADSMTRAMIASALSIGLSLVNIAIVWRANRWHPRSSLVWIGLALFAMGVAAITALGRSATSDTALTPRYQGISPLWWIAVIMIGAMAVVAVRQQAGAAHAESGGLSASSAHGITAINLFALIVGVSAAIGSSAYGLEVGRHWMDKERQCEVAMRDFETASTDCIRAYGPGKQVTKSMPYLEARRFSIFRDESID